MKRFALAVHGGAFHIPGEEREPHRRGCLEAATVGWRILEGGGTAVDAVEETVRVLEASGIFMAGRGSSLNEEGVIEVDAGIMQGADLATGSVAAVKGVLHPITLARRVMESPEAVIVGRGAELFAERSGVERCDPEHLVSEQERKRWLARKANPQPDWAGDLFGDTVGAVALDFHGDIAAGTSTGGAPFKPPGRVGDSPFVGAGLYADNCTGGVSTTGHGERIIQVVMAKAAADLIGGGMHPQAAAEKALLSLQRVNGRAGLITLDPQGRVGVAWSTPHMAYAVRGAGQSDFECGP